jgi:hypothetical protein
MSTTTVRLTRLDLATIERLSRIQYDLEVRLEHLTGDESDLWYLFRNLTRNNGGRDDDCFTLPIEIARNVLEMLLVSVVQELARLGVTINNG